MNILAHIALLFFPLFTLGLFLRLSPRRAVIAIYVLGWLFLPQAGYAIPALPDYDKPAVITLAALLGTVVFDFSRLGSFRSSWFDLPIAVFCLCPMATHIYNGNGPLTGANWVIAHVCLWGGPYFMGRIYFRRPEDVPDLAIGIFLAGLVYAPLCWYEIRMSPQLHAKLYGFFQHNFLQHIRYNGFRPIVFMQHGIMVGTWMTSATLIGAAVWRAKILKRVSLLGLISAPMGILVPFLAITTVFCKVGSAVAALGLGTSVLLAYRFGVGRLALTALAIVPPTYMFVRTTGLWTGDSLTSVISQYDEERGGSLAIRMHQEDLYTTRALSSPYFGFGNGDFIPKDEQGHNLARGNDGFWIITFGLYGGISLVSCFLTLVLPALLVAIRPPAAGALAGNEDLVAALALVVVLFAIDCLVNGMINPIYLMCAGAAMSAALAPASTLAPFHSSQRISRLVMEEAYG